MLNWALDKQAYGCRQDENSCDVERNQMKSSVTNYGVPDRYIAISKAHWGFTVGDQFIETLLQSICQSLSFRPSELFAELLGPGLILCSRSEHDHNIIKGSSSGNEHFAINTPPCNWLDHYMQSQRGNLLTCGPM
jgi:hypothetical protein